MIRAATEFRSVSGPVQFASPMDSKKNGPWASAEEGHGRSTRRMQCVCTGLGAHMVLRNLLYGDSHKSTNSGLRELTWTQVLPRLAWAWSAVTMKNTAWQLLNTIVKN